MPFFPQKVADVFRCDSLSGGGDVLTRLADAGEDHPVPPTDLHLRENGQQLPTSLREQRVDAGEEERVSFVGEGETVMLQQKVPTLVVEQAAVNGNQGVVL